MLEPLPPPPERPVLDWLQSGQGLAVSGVGLSVSSVVLVLYGASEEPFFVFNPADALLFFALGPLLMLALVVWLIATVATLAFEAKRVMWVAAPPIVLWVVVSSMYLGLCVYGYWADMTNPYYGPWR